MRKNLCDPGFEVNAPPKPGTLRMDKTEPGYPPQGRDMSEGRGGRGLTGHFTVLDSTDGFYPRSGHAHMFGWFFLCGRVCPVDPLPLTSDFDPLQWLLLDDDCHTIP